MTESETVFVPKSRQTPFEDYLRDVHAEHHAEGVLDDDMPDHFDNWLSSLDGDQLIEYGNEAMIKIKK